MNPPFDLKYTKSHEWVAEHGDGLVAVGITDVAAEQLGDLVYVELPKLGAKVSRSETCAVVESSKAAADVYSPVTGEIVAVNQSLTEHPEKVNASPYRDGWLFKVKLAEPVEGLLSRDEYLNASKT